MAYISAFEVGQIRVELKRQFPEFKFGVRCMSNHLGVEVTIKSGPVRFHPNDNVNINQFYPGNYQNSDILVKMLDVINNGSSKKNYDHSDAMFDHFDIGFHVSISQGSWKSPYILKKKVS